MATSTSPAWATPVLTRADVAGGFSQPTNARPREDLHRSLSRMGAHLPIDNVDSPPVATPRRTGPCLARRTYQTGNVYQKGKGKLNEWDENAPAYGRFWKDVPGAKRQRITIPLGICRTRSMAERKCMAEINELKLNSTQYLAQATSSVTFRRQAEMWLESLGKRRNNPLEQTMASAINDDGEEMFPRMWNAEFIDAPPIGKQNQPASDCAGVTDILFYALGQY